MHTKALAALPLLGFGLLLAPAAARGADSRPPAAEAKSVLVKDAYEIFTDRNDVFVRAGSVEGLKVGGTVQVVGPVHGASRPLYGTAAVLEVWEHLARIHLDLAAAAAKGVTFAALDVQPGPAPAPAAPKPEVVDAAPTGRPAPPPSSAPAPAPARGGAAKQLDGQAWLSGFGPASRVNIANLSKQNWTQCEARLPNNKHYRWGTISAGDKDGVLLIKFAQDGVERDVELTQLVLSCAEGGAVFRLK